MRVIVRMRNGQEIKAFNKNKKNPAVFGTH